MDALVVAGTAGSTIIVGFLILWLFLLTKKTNQVSEDISAVSNARYDDVRKLEAEEKEQREKVIAAMAADVKNLAAKIAEAKEAAMDHAEVAVKNASAELREELNVNIGERFLTNAARVDHVDEKIETLNKAIGGTEVKISALKTEVAACSELIESYRRRAGYLENFEVLATQLGIDEQTASVLCSKEFTTPLAIAYAESVEFALASELPLKVAVEIHAKAKKLTEKPAEVEEVKVKILGEEKVEPEVPKIIIARK